MSDLTKKTLLGFQQMGEAVASKLTFTGLSGTPSSYDDGKFLVSLPDGIGYTGLSGQISSEEIDWNVYATPVDLPSATLHHGMFAHVHSEGAGYMAHAGQWEKIYPQSFTGLSDTPSSLTADKYLKVNSAGDGFVFSDVGGGGGGGSSSNVIIQQGTYTGNTTIANTKQIIDLGFTPIRVEIFGRNSYNSHAIMLKDAPDTYFSWEDTNDHNTYRNTVQASKIVNNGFEVSNENTPNPSHLNYNGVVFDYYATAEADDSSSAGGGGGGASVAQSTYVGDGSTTGIYIPLDFTPVEVQIHSEGHIKDHGPHYGKTTLLLSTSGQQSIYTYGSPASNSRGRTNVGTISGQGFVAMGYINDSNFNVNGCTYHYVAIGSGAGGGSSSAGGGGGGGGSSAATECSGGAFSNQDIKGAFAGDFTLPDAIVVPITRNSVNQLRIFHLNGLHNGTISSPQFIQYEWIIGEQERYTINFYNDSGGTFQTQYSKQAATFTTSVQWSEIQSAINDEPTLKEFIADNKAIYYGGCSDSSSSGGSSSSAGFGSLDVVKNQVENFYTDLPDYIVATTLQGFEAILRLKFAGTTALALAGNVPGKSFWYEARHANVGDSDYGLIFTDDADGSFNDQLETDQFPASMEQNLKWFIDNGRAIYGASSSGGSSSDGSCSGGIGPNPIITGISNFYTNIPDQIVLDDNNGSANVYSLSAVSSSIINYQMDDSAMRLILDNDLEGTFKSIDVSSHAPHSSLSGYIAAGRAVYLGGCGSSSAGGGVGSSDFTGLSDTPNSYDPGKFLQSSAAGLDWVDAPAGGGGSSTFTGLTDTSNTFAGASGKYLTVNSSEDAVEFTPLDLGDADLDFSVESTNVQFIEKRLNTNIKSDQTISDFTFPNLIVGKTYRVSATLSFYSETETNLVQAEIYNGANHLVTLSNKGRSTTASASILFIAAHDSVTVEGKNLSTIDYILGDPTISIVQLELPPSAIVTVEQQVVNPSNPPAGGIFTIGDVNVHASINDFQNHSNELSGISDGIFAGNIIQAANINSTINIQDISTQNTFEDIDGDLTSFGVINIADMKVNTIIRHTGDQDLSNQSPFDDHSLDESYPTLKFSFTGIA